MLQVLKTAATVLTVVEAAKFGKKQYNKYRDAKQKRRMEEVHEFINNVNSAELQKAIDEGDQEKLIDAVESIMSASNDVQQKTEWEALKQDLSGITDDAVSSVKEFWSGIVGSDEYKAASETVSQTASEVSDKLATKANEAADKLGRGSDIAAEKLSEGAERVVETVDQKVDSLTDYLGDLFGGVSEAVKEAKNDMAKQEKEEAMLRESQRQAEEVINQLRKKREEEKVVDTPQKQEEKPQPKEDVPNPFGELANVVGEVHKEIEEAQKKAEQEKSEPVEAEFEEDDTPNDSQPTFEEFMTGAQLEVNFVLYGVKRMVTVDAKDITINVASKTVNVPHPNDKSYVEKVVLK